MVETSGLEPPTPWLQTRCSPIELRPQVFQRTPVFTGGSLVGPGRVELPTSPLSGARSSQLSYEPFSTDKKAKAKALAYILPIGLMPPLPSGYLAILSGQSHLSIAAVSGEVPFENLTA
jgi:hypothetical protein